MRLRALALLLAVLPTTGCLFRTRPIEETYSQTTLREASQSGLIHIINQQADRVQSLQATVEIDTSAGEVNKGHITEYKEIRGYVLARKPAMLHMIGLLPIVRTPAFDMVSNGEEFKMWIPPRDRFVVGRNEVLTHNADQTMESILPQDIFEALLIQPIDPEREIVVLENGFDLLSEAKGHRVLQPDYKLVVIRTGERGWKLARKIVFSRSDLQPNRQYIYDEQGNLITEARYTNYRDCYGVTFPSRVEIYRPLEGHAITLNMLKMEINKPLRDDQFTLEQPPGPR
jgi:hypothetical protein